MTASDRGVKHGNHDITVPVLANDSLIRKTSAMRALLTGMAVLWLATLSIMALLQLVRPAGQGSNMTRPQMVSAVGSHRS